MDVHILAAETYLNYATMVENEAQRERDEHQSTTDNKTLQRQSPTTSKRNDSVVTVDSDNVMLSGKTIIRCLDQGRKSSWPLTAFISDSPEIMAIALAQEMEEGISPVLQSSTSAGEAFARAHTEAIRFGMICVLVIFLVLIVAWFCGEAR